MNHAVKESALESMGAVTGISLPDDPGFTLMLDYVKDRDRDRDRASGSWDLYPGLPGTGS